MNYLFLTVSEKSRNVFNDGRYHVISIIDPGAQVHRDSRSSCPNILVIIIIFFRFEKKLINNAENKCMNAFSTHPLYKHVYRLFENTPSLFSIYYTYIYSTYRTL